MAYPQYFVLMLLWEQDNRIVSDITDRLHLETNTITPLLQRMGMAREIVSRGMTEDELRKQYNFTKYAE